MVYLYQWAAWALCLLHGRTPSACESSALRWCCSAPARAPPHRRRLLHSGVLVAVNVFAVVRSAIPWWRATLLGGGCCCFRLSRLGCCRLRPTAPSPRCCYYCPPPRTRTPHHRWESPAAVRACALVVLLLLQERRRSEHRAAVVAKIELPHTCGSAGRHPGANYSLFDLRVIL